LEIVKASEERSLKNKDPKTNWWERNAKSQRIHHDKWKTKKRQDVCGGQDQGRMVKTKRRKERMKGVRKRSKPAERTRREPNKREKGIRKRASESHHGRANVKKCR